MRANRTQYRAPTIGKGMEARMAPNFPVYRRLYHEYKNAEQNVSCDHRGMY